MPLLKLWNSLRGRSTQAQQTDLSPTDSPVTSEPGVSNSARSTSAKSEAGASRSRPKPVSQTKSTGFGLFRGGQHSGLKKLIKPLSAQTVLEIGVGDGSRALEVLQTLSKAGNDASYIGIDGFELAGSVSLKEIHRTLRSGGVRPQLFPGPADLGIMRIAHTIGSVDLILVSAGPDHSQNDAVLSLLSRICHPNTVVLMEQDETWSRVSTPQRAGFRRAA